MAHDTEAPDSGARPLKGYATFEQHKLVLADAGVELVRKKTLSPSTAATVSSCGARFAVERLLERLAPRVSDPLGAAELGTATHQVFEDLFARPKGERGLLAGAQLLERLEVDHPELEAPSDPELLARWRSEVQTRVVGLWEVENPDEIDVVARELHLTVDLDGIAFNGFIDRVRRFGDGLTVTDYKGGAGKMKRENARYGDAHGDQIRLYARALQTARPDLGEITGGEVLYVFHRKRRDVDMSTKALDGTRARYEKAWKLLTTQTETGAFGMRTSPLCGWCPAVQVCPAALAAGKEPKDPCAEAGALLGIETSPTTTAPSRAGVNGSSTPGRGSTEEDYDPAIDFGDGTASSGQIAAASSNAGAGSQLASASSEAAEPTEPPAGPITGAAGAVPAPPSSETPTATTTSSETGTTSRSPATTRSASMYDELKPWEETNSDGTLNLNSYAATAAFGTVALAVETLHAAEQKITPKAVDAFAETLALVIQRCQEALDVRPSMQDGSHTRLRGALRTSIETMPAPFGKDVATWAEWVKRTEKRVLSIHGAALRLWSTGGQEAEPWAALAVANLEAA